MATNCRGVLDRCLQGIGVTWSSRNVRPTPVIVEDFEEDSNIAARHQSKCDVVMIECDCIE